MKKILTILVVIAIGCPVLLCAAGAGNAAAPSPRSAKPKEPAWAQEPKTFRDIPWGATTDEAKKITDIGECFTGQDKTQTVCSNDLPLGDYEVKIYFLFAEDHFVEAFFNFPSENFEYFRDAFIAKYGQPSETSTDTVQNRMGATFQQEEHTWSGPTARANISKYSGKVTEGMAYVCLQSFYRETAEKGKDKAKKAADDF